MGRKRSNRDRQVLVVTITARARPEIDGLHEPIRVRAEETLGNREHRDPGRLDELLDRVGAPLAGASPDSGPAS